MLSLSTSNGSPEFCNGSPVPLERAIESSKKQEEDMLLLFWKDWFVFGRQDSGEDLISRTHFAIRKKDGRIYVKDCSANGTWLNHQRITQEELHPGDVLQAGGYSFLIWENLIFTDCTWLKNCESSTQETALFTRGPKQSKISHTMTDHVRRKKKDYLTQSRNPVSLSVESFGPLPELSLPHWFTSLGSAGMIMVSSLASAAAAWMTTGNLQTVSTMALSSGSMAIAFLGYGLINRRIQKKTACQKVQKQIHAYDHYLDEIMQTTQKMIRDFSAQTLQFEEDWQQEEFDGWFSRKNNWYLPITLIRQSAVELQLPSIRYDQHDHPGALRLKEMTEKPFLASTPLWFSKGEILYIRKPDSGRIFSFFAFWCLLAGNEKRKFVQIGQRWINIHHPACMVEDTFLYFANTHEFLLFAARFSQVEWTILSAEPPASLSHLQKEKMSWLIFGDPASRDDDSTCLELSGSFYPCIKQPEIDRTKIHRFWPARETSFWKTILKNAAEIPEQNSRQQSSQKRLSCDLAVFLDEGICLDLKKDGPHLLIAGTTGSGKSEGLNTVLLQLLLKNDPEYLSMILIDFKGGSFASSFSHCPHLCGMMSNLEEAEFHRLETALNEELDRRQKKIRIWKEKDPYASADIESYNCTHPDQPLSHLLIVVDEFAELKMRLPHAMRYLQQTARIGRSLGVHLVLATQKPSGVVDEQILSNISCRLCFRVEDLPDSKMMSGTEEAVYLKEPGSFILSGSKANVTDQNEHKETCFKGRILYCQQPEEDHFIMTELDENQEMLWQSNPGKSVLEKGMEIIQKRRGTKPSWLLHPSLCEVSEIPIPGALDEIHQLALWKWQPGMRILFGAQESALIKNVQAIVSGSLFPVCAFGLPWQAVHPELCMLELSQLWQLEEMEQCHLVFIYADLHASRKVLEAAFSLPDHIVIFLCDQAGGKLGWLFQQKYTDRILGTSADRDLCCQVLMKKEQLPLNDRLLIHMKNGIQKNLMFSLPETEKTAEAESGKETEKRPRKANRRADLVPFTNPVTPGQLRKMKSPRLLGFDLESGRPLYAATHHPVVFLCTGDEQIQKALHLVSLWKQIDPMIEVSLNQIEGAVSIIQPESVLLEKLAAAGKEHPVSMIWLGAGIGEYYWKLNVKLPESHSGQAYLLTPACSVGFELARPAEQK